MDKIIRCHINISALVASLGAFVGCLVTLAAIFGVGLVLCAWLLGAE